MSNANPFFPDFDASKFVASWVPPDCVALLGDRTTVFANLKTGLVWSVPKRERGESFADFRDRAITTALGARE